MMLSVVIPNYNGSRTILSVIQSLQEQVPSDTEILVVDDASTDDSINLIRESFSSIKIWQNESNLGTAASRNIGIKHTTGAFILFLDSDVIIQPNCLNILLTEKNTANILFPRILYPNLEPMYPVNRIQSEYLMISPIFLLDRSALARMPAPYFDENFRVYDEDTDFFLQAYLAGLTCAFCQEAIAIHNVDYRSGGREIRYFLEIRNAIYGAVKYRGIKGLNKFDHAFKPTNIIKVVICGLFNFNLFDLQARGHQKYPGVSRTLRLFFNKHERISEKGSMYLLILTFKALWWNVRNLRLSLKARNCLTNFINTAKDG